MRCTLREHHRQQQQQQICSPNIDLSIIRCELCPTDCCVALAFFFLANISHTQRTRGIFSVCRVLFHSIQQQQQTEAVQMKKKKEKHDENLVCHLQF